MDETIRTIHVGYRRVLRFSLYATLVFLTGCASVGNAKEAAQRWAELPGEPATVYLIRGKTIPYARVATIRVDNHELAKLKSKSFVVLDVPPGSREFFIDWSWDVDLYGDMDLKFNHDVKPGETLYFEYGSVESKGSGVRMASAGSVSYPVSTPRTNSAYYLYVVDAERFEQLKREGYVALPVE
ncbi:MAG: hypothetical protein AAF465_04295 [Pseudomonadota bacterium]